MIAVACGRLSKWILYNAGIFYNFNCKTYYLFDRFKARKKNGKIIVPAITPKLFHIAHAM